VNSTQTIFIVRHAEKPADDGSVGGVSESGAPDPNELSVRGWQRAGALARFFAAGEPRQLAMRPPDALFAAAPAGGYRSRRNVSTLTPLARLLGIAICERFSKGDEAALAACIESMGGSIVIAWKHRAIPALATRLASGNPSMLPAAWPEDRFDLVWMFAKDNSAPRRFMQFPQLLLAGDTSTVA
jgi:hypothetical protein